MNTDAEGRLILGDGLWYAQQLGATHLVDVATLTGACVVALGKAHRGLFGRPDAWVDARARDLGARRRSLLADAALRRVLRAAEERDRRHDATPAAGRPARVTAAVFLKEFAGDLPWAHLDIAGTAWADDAQAVAGQGRNRRRGPHARGAGVRPAAGQLEA